MRITSILPKEGVMDQLEAHSSEEVLHALSEMLGKLDLSLNSEEVFSVLEEREKLGSTGINDGVAIPHNKLASAKKISACFARSSRGIDFNSPDGKPTYLFFAIIGPENATGMHLKILARLSKILKEESIRKKLREAKDKNEIYAILSEADEKV